MLGDFTEGKGVSLLLLGVVVAVLVTLYNIVSSVPSSADRLPEQWRAAAYALDAWAPGQAVTLDELTASMEADEAAAVREAAQAGWLKWTDHHMTVYPGDDLTSVYSVLGGTLSDHGRGLRWSR